MTAHQMYALRVGDVVARYERDGRATLRVIRGVFPPTKRSAAHRFNVEVVKQVRSRYPGPTTLLYPDELLSRHYQPTGKRLRLTSRLDKLVARHIAAHGPVDRKDWYCVTQNEVVGVIA